MLQTLLAYGKGAGIENRWLVLDGDPEFFRITKRMHNLLHGSPGDGGPLGQAEHDHYRAVLAANLEQLERRVVPGRHRADPRPADRRPGRRITPAGRTSRLALSRRVRRADRRRAEWGGSSCGRTSSTPNVWSSRDGSTPPHGPTTSRLVVIPPSIDPFSAKNVPLTADQVASVLTTVGLLADGDPDGPVGFTRRDGTPGRVRPIGGPAASCSRPSRRRCGCLWWCRSAGGTGSRTCPE